ncbi:MAG: Flp family type IVb pilin [Burkholderiaceae bacterium]|nr:Flp family type IVb pilin [Burkholderiaceae bacterium]
MKHAILRFIRDEQGATAIEYGLLAGLIAAAIVVAVTSVGSSLSGLFNSIAATLGKL